MLHTMGKDKVLTTEEITKINYIKSEGYSNRNIAGMFHRSTLIVNKYLRDPEYYGTNRKGHTKLTTAPPERAFLLRGASNSTNIAREIASRVDIYANIRTIRRIRQSNSLTAKYNIKKIVLSNEHRVTRL